MLTVAKIFIMEAHFTQLLIVQETHNEILQLYHDLIDPTFTWENFSIEEQDLILKSKRSNNHLDTSTLESMYPDVPSIREAVVSYLSKKNV